MAIVPLGGGRFVDTSTGKAPAKSAAPASSNSQFGSDTPWAKAVAAYKPPATTPVPTPTTNSSNKGTLSSISPEAHDVEPVAPSASFSAASVSSVKPDVKPATPDLVQIKEDVVPVEVMTTLLFENIGGTEILGMSRHDLINGIDIAYQQISNLAKVESTFGGQSLISLHNSTEQIFKSYGLRRYQYVPSSTDDPNGLNNHVYLDSSGSLIIELDNLLPDMEIEVEFKTADTDDIMY